MSQVGSSPRGSKGLLPSARRTLPTVAVVVGLMLVLPVAGMAIRAPWGHAWEVLSRPGVLQAAKLSLVVSACAVALSLVIGFPIAWTLARCDFWGRSIVRTLVLLPMVVPPVVGGVALLAAFGSHGLLGPALRSLGVRLPFTTAGAVLAVTFVSCPFMILSLEAGLTSLNRRLEQAAESLGASDWTVLRRIVVPAMGPALRAGMALTGARALGEFGATIAFAGSRPGRTRTLPLAIYEALSSDLESAVMLGLLLVCISVVLLLALRGRVFAR